MIAISVAIVCATFLIAQYRHQLKMSAVDGAYDILVRCQERILALESKAANSFDQQAFDDLRNKVEALRISQGMKASR